MKKIIIIIIIAILLVNTSLAFTTKITDVNSYFYNLYGNNSMCLVGDCITSWSSAGLSLFQISSNIGNWSDDKTSYLTTIQTNNILTGNMSLAYSNESRLENKINSVINLSMTTVTASNGNFSANNASLWAGINERIKNNTIANLSNIYSTSNMTVEGYFMGQPLLGMLGSGIISSVQTNALSEVNITCAGLTCSYNSFVVRLNIGTSSQNSKYCSISANSIVATNNAHNLFYVDNNCTVQKTTVDTWFNGLLATGGMWDFGNAVCHDGSCEVVNGISIEQRRMMKQRIINYHSDHLKVVTGLSRTPTTFPNWNLSSGEYIYLMDVVTTTQKAVGTIEVIAPNTSTGWILSQQSSMNYTFCTNGTNAITCSNANRYRRVFFFMIGYNSTVDSTEVHQLLPSENRSYLQESDCLDVVTNSLDYTLPDFYVSSAVPLWAYCVRASDSAWSSTGWIDLRTVKTGDSSVSSSGAGVPYVGATQNLDMDGFNVSASSFIGSGASLTGVLPLSENASLARYNFDGFSFNGTGNFVTTGNVTGLERIGIGTNSPISKLQLIGGNIYLDRGYGVYSQLSNSTRAGIVLGTNNEITFYTGLTAQAMVIDQNGNVGINNTAPFGKLDIGSGQSGNLGFVNINSSSNFAAMTVYTKVVSYPTFGFNVNVTANGQVEFLGNTGNNHQIWLKNYGNGKYNLRVANDTFIGGNLGVNTITPTTTLDVNGTANITTLRVRSYYYINESIVIEKNSTHRCFGGC